MPIFTPLLNFAHAHSKKKKNTIKHDGFLARPRLKMKPACYVQGCATYSSSLLFVPPTPSLPFLAGKPALFSQVAPYRLPKHVQRPIYTPNRRCLPATLLECHLPEPKSATTLDGASPRPPASEVPASLAWPSPRQLKKKKTVPQSGKSREDCSPQKPSQGNPLLSAFPPPT